MAISRQQKEELVAAYGQLLQETGGFILTGYSGLSVGQLHDLRQRLRANNASYVITRNRLFKLALQANDWPVPDEMLQGPVATAFANGDMPGMAKTLLAFRDDYEELFVVKGGIMDGDVLGPAEVEALSRLPTLDELRASLAGLVLQPAAGIVNTLNAATVDVVNVLQAYVQENSETEEQEEAA